MHILTRDVIRHYFIEKIRYNVCYVRAYAFPEHAHISICIHVTRDILNICVRDAYAFCEHVIAHICVFMHVLTRDVIKLLFHPKISNIIYVCTQ